MAAQLTIRRTYGGSYVARVEDKWGNGFNIWNTESKTREECQEKVDKAHFSQEWMERCLESEKNLRAMCLAVDCRAIH